MAAYLPFTGLGLTAPAFSKRVGMAPVAPRDAEDQGSPWRGGKGAEAQRGRARGRQLRFEGRILKSLREAKGLIFVLVWELNGEKKKNPTNPYI